MGGRSDNIPPGVVDYYIHPQNPGGINVFLLYAVQQV